LNNSSLSIFLSLFIGKSSFGNAILEKKNQFKSLKTAKSVTKKCEVHDRIFHDIRLLVVDTPGFFDTELKPKDLIPEIYSSYQVAAPGPHAFFVVFTTDRFTIQEQTVAEWIYKVFDERALDYCIIVFTGLDGLEKNNQTIEEFLQDAPEFLTNLIQKCNGRYIAIDNTASDDKIEEKSKILLEKISMMVKKNGGQYYNNKSFIQIADVLKKYPDWFDPVKSDGTVNLVEETANIVARELNANAIFKNQ
jgi:predicted GTPase